MKEIDRRVFICSCHSLEHQYTFWYDEDENEMYFEPHLSGDKSLYERLKIAIKYVLGKKTIYGAWDSVLIKEDDRVKILKFLGKADVDINLIADRGRD